MLTESRPGGGAACEGFNIVPILNPALILIQTDGSNEAATTAERLRDTLRFELNRLGTGRPRVPCGGSRPGLSCAGFDEPNCRKVLLLVSGGKTRMKMTPLADDFLKAGPNFHILPIVPQGADPSKLFPRKIKPTNAVVGEPATIAPAVLALAELTTADRRIFISYRRKDAQPLADQLFDALTHARFDVFLDRFRVDPGVDFQRRLTEELAHKSMVLLLESANILKSKWTMYEINYAKKHRLGLLALRLPDGATVASIDPDERIALRRGQFTGVRSIKLKTKELEKIVARIDSVHGVALLRRRGFLREAMRAALLAEGGTDQRFAEDGLLIVRRQDGDRRIQLTTRPPELGDFHLTGRRLSGTERGIVIGPADMLAAQTTAELNWLSGVSSISYFDEGQMKAVAREIVGGTL